MELFRILRFAITSDPLIGCVYQFHHLTIAIYVKELVLVGLEGFEPSPYCYFGTLFKSVVYCQFHQRPI